MPKPTMSSECHQLPAWTGVDPDSAPHSSVRFMQPVEDFSLLQNVKAAGSQTQLITKSGVYELSSGPSGLSRVRFFLSFLSKVEADELFDNLMEQVPWGQFSDVQNGVKVLQPRLVAWYGPVPYTYSQLTHPPNTEWLPPLERVRTKLEECTGSRVNSVLCNLYKDGKDFVQWHSDDEDIFGSNPSILSVSLGETRMFELRKIGDKNASGEATYTEYVQVPLTHGSLVTMEGAMQCDWQHRVPVEDNKGPRINLTFRYAITS